MIYMCVVRMVVSEKIIKGPKRIFGDGGVVSVESNAGNNRADNWLSRLQLRPPQDSSLTKFLFLVTQTTIVCTSSPRGRVFCFFLCPFTPPGDYTGVCKDLGLHAADERNELSIFVDAYESAQVRAS